MYTLTLLLYFINYYSHITTLCIKINAHYSSCTCMYIKGERVRENGVWVFLVSNLTYHLLCRRMSPFLTDSLKDRKYMVVESVLNGIDITLIYYHFMCGS